MNRPSLLPWILAIALFGAGCAPSPIAATGNKRPPRASDVTNQQEPAASPTPLADPARAYRGTVLGLDGLPAANVTVRGHLVSNNGSGLVSDRGSSIISANGGSYRLLSESALEVQTDAEGHFTIEHPENQPLNLEAIAGPDLKAIRFNVAADATDVTLQLAPTGTISGKVTAPDAPGVTDFQGVDVYIPGTGYIAKTASSGAYTIPNVPVGSFTLVAEKIGLGAGAIKEVAVESKTTTTAPDLALSVTVPTIASVSPAHAAPGVEVTIKGEHFGHSSGATLEVSFGGVDAISPTRIDDQTIKVKVPGTAGSDGIVIKVNQIASQLKAFQVVKKLSLAPSTRFVVAGSELTFTPSAEDSNGQAVENPIVKWTALGQATVDDGLVTATAVGTAEIEVEAGPSLKKVHKLTVVASQAEMPGNQDLTYSAGLAITASGHFVMGEENLFKVNPADGSTTVFAGPRAASAAAQYVFDYPTGLVADSAGALYTCNGGLLKIGTDGSVTPFATSLSGVQALGMGPDDTLYAFIWDDTSRLVKITSAGVVTDMPGDYSEMDAYHVAVAEDGTVYLASDGQVFEVTETGPQPIEVSDFGYITGLAVAPDGSLFVADCPNMTTTIKRIDLDVPAVSTPALTPAVTLGETLGGMIFDDTGALLVVDAEKGKFHSLTLPL